MAQREQVTANTSVITLSRAEALEVVVFLTSQLAGCPVPNNASGRVPSIDIIDGGVLVSRILLGLK